MPALYRSFRMNAVCSFFSVLSPHGCDARDMSTAGRQLLQFNGGTTEVSPYFRVSRGRLCRPVAPDTPA